MNQATPPPHSSESEAAVIGACLIDPTAYQEIADIVRPESFYDEKCRLVFEAIVALDARAVTIDSVIVKNELIGRATFQRLGGAEPLLTFMEATTTSAAVRHHAEIVRNSARARAVIGVCRQTLADTHALQQDPDGIIDRLEQRLYDIRQDRPATTFQLRDEIAQLLNDVETRGSQPDQLGILTGFTDLDEKLLGMRPGEVIVLAARPSMGKSSLANNIAINAASKAGKDVLVFTLEVRARQVIENMIISESRVNSSDVRRGQLRDAQWAQIAEAGSKLVDSRDIVINDQAGITCQEMRAVARREASRSGRRLGLVVVDHIQLVRYPGTDGRLNELTMISQSLKALARDLNVPVLCLSQLNRQAENRDKHRPLLCDLRESGSIEQDADVVLLLYRDGYYNPNSPPHIANVCEVTIAKNRNGPTGVVRLYFDKECLRFRDIAHAAGPEERCHG